jgi:hypothetical protein
MMVDSAKRSAPMTHFISIPIAGGEFEHSCEQFKETALKVGDHPLCHLAPFCATWL